MAARWVIFVPHGPLSLPWAKQTRFSGNVGIVSMIAKPHQGKARQQHGKPSRTPREPLDVRLTLRFKFGDRPADAITVMNERRMPMVNSVFANRDRILRGFVQLLLRSGLSSPSVARELVPVLRLLRRARRP